MQVIAIIFLFIQWINQKRVIIHICIGYLKGHFQSLRGIYTQINGRNDVARINVWIRTCCILHNFFLECKDKAKLREKRDGPKRILANISNISELNQDYFKEQEESSKLRPSKGKPFWEAESGPEWRLLMMETVVPNK